MTKTRELPVTAMKHKNRWLMVPVALLMISALFFPAIIVSADPATDVTVEPTPKTVGIGETFTVDIFVNPDTGICGVQFDLSFNSSVLLANSVIEGNLLNQNGDPTLFAPGTINNGAGTITNVYGLIMTPGVTVSQNGTFATISFTAGTAVGTSALTLSKVKVANTAGEVTTTVTHGSVTVYSDEDVNMDGHVNISDLTRVGQHFGQTGSPHWIREDVDRSGEIDIVDMVRIVQEWTG